jgi:hypothetical protein
MQWMLESLYWLWFWHGQLAIEAMCKLPKSDRNYQFERKFNSVTYWYQEMDTFQNALRSILQTPS